MYWSDFKALPGQGMIRGDALRDDCGIWNDLELFVNSGCRISRGGCAGDPAIDGHRMAFRQLTSRYNPTFAFANLIRKAMSRAWEYRGNKSGSFKLAHISLNGHTSTYGSKLSRADLREAQLQRQIPR
jgi:hypothetical protein